jgi:hypothetical protein
MYIGKFMWLLADTKSREHQSEFPMLQPHDGRLSFEMSQHGAAAL